MGVEVAALYASLEANVAPLDAALAEADAGLKAVADQAAVTTDIVAGLGAGAGTAAAGLAEAGVAAGTTAAADTGLAAAAGEAAAATEAQAVSSKGLMSTMNGLLGPLLGVTIGVGAIKGAFDTTVGSTLTLADQTRKLQRDIGATAAEADKLIYAANVVGVNVDAMAKSFDMAINKMRSHRADGIAPNIEGLGILADKYNALQDPIQRTQFLIDEFGRSGANLAPLMALGSAGIKDLGVQAAAAGVVMSQQGVDSAYKYEQSAKRLDEAWTGFKLTIGEGVIPVLTSLTEAMNSGVTFQGLLTQAQKEGIDTSKYVQTTTQDGIVIVTNQKEATFELTEAIAAYTASLQDNNDASDRAAGRSQALTDSNTANTRAYSDAASIIAGYTDNVNLQATSQWNAQQATDAYNKTVQDQIDKTQLQIGAGLAAAAMNNSIDNAQQTYLKTVKSSQPEIDKLTKQIDQMQAANGKLVTTVVAGKVSQEDYNLAVDRAALSQAKYDAALQGTVDKHGKLHQANDLTLEGLRIAAESAQNAVDKLGAKMGSSTTGIADYSKAIADAQGKLSDLQQKEADAEKQVADTTGKFILQQLALDMKLSPAMEIQMAHALGLVNDKEYTLAKTVEGATKLWDLNKNGVIDAGIEYDSLTKYLADQQAQVVKTSGEMPPLQTNIANVGGAAHHAGDDLKYAADQEDRLHDKTVTVNVNTQYGAGGPGYTGGGGNDATGAGGGNNNPYSGVPGYAAAGGEFMIPAGYNENYPVGPYVASSGETVTITPNGGRRAGGGNTYVTINDKLAGALYLENLRQQRLTKMERMI